jgi:hypothetical protein
MIIEIEQSNGFDPVTIERDEGLVELRQPKSPDVKSILLMSEDARALGRVFRQAALELQKSTWTETYNLNSLGLILVVNGHLHGNSGDWRLYSYHTPFRKQISGSRHLNEMADTLIGA